MLPVLLLIILEVVAALRTAQLKGNLLFESEQQSAVTINPHYIQFNRQFDLSHIRDAINLLTNYTDSYAQYCNEVTKDRKRLFDMFQVQSMYYKAKQTCKSNGGYLPQIKTEADADKLMDMMKLINIKETPAGLMIRNASLLYYREETPNEYKQYQACDECTIQRHFVGNPNNRALVYAYDDTNSLYIRETVCQHGKCEKEIPILCTRGMDYDSNILTTMASHSCHRDKFFMQETNRFLMQEYESFIDATGSTNKRKKRFAPPRRRRRMIPAIPIIAGGVLGGGLISHAITGTNPFAFIGEIVGGVFGLATAREMQLTRDMINKLSFEMVKIKVNQQAIVTAIEGLSNHALKLEKLIRYQTHDIAVMYGELDSKIAMRYLQSIIQITLLKVHASMVAARQFKPSPYVFGQSDLKQLVSDRRFFRHKMTSNLEEVGTTLIVVDDKFTFLIAVPLKDERSQYFTYRIHQLPIFNANKSYHAILSNEYYAINPITNEYIQLTDTDYSACSQRPICATQAPVFAITTKSPCEISTYLYSTQHCPLTIAPSMGPSFFNYGNTTFYSVPEPLQVNVRCSINGKTLSKHEKIDGMGSFQAHTGCTTQITEQAQIRPIHVAEIHDLDSNSVFGVLKQYNFSSIQYPKDPDQESTTFKPITILEVSSFSEGLNLLLDVQTNSTDVARIFLVLAIFIILFLTIYISVKPFKLWFDDCCSFTKPHKYWGQKYINVPQFVKIHRPQSHFHERLQQTFSNIRNFFTRTSQTNNATNDEFYDVHEPPRPTRPAPIYPDLQHV